MKVSKAIDLLKAMFKMTGQDSEVCFIHDAGEHIEIIYPNTVSSVSVDGKQEVCAFMTRALTEQLPYDNPELN